MDYNIFKLQGTVYQIPDTETKITAKGEYQIRHVMIEVPTVNPSQKTSVLKFKMFGDECDVLDMLSEGDWIEIMFRITGKFWKPPNEDKKIHFQNLDLVTIQKQPNPFKENKDKDHTAEELSSNVFADVDKRVKEFVKDPLSPDDHSNDLPF